MDGYFGVSMDRMTFRNGTLVPMDGIDPPIANASSLTLTSFFTVVGSSLSLVGLVFAFITYSLFSDLRTVLGTCLMNLFASLFLSQLLFVIGAENPLGSAVDLPSASMFCVVVSMCQHYLWLATITWVTTMVYEMYRMYRSNMNLQPAQPTYAELNWSYIKYCIFGWGCPCLSVILVTFIHFGTDADHQSHVHIRDNGQNQTTKRLVDYNCWIVGPGSMMYGLMIPAIILLLFNIYNLIRTTLIVKYIAGLQVDPKAKKKIKRNRSIQLLLYIKVVSLFYVTLGLAGLSFIGGYSIFWYPFVLINSIQGVVVALVYTCNSKIFKMYSKSISSKMKQSKRSNYGITATPGNVNATSGSASSLALLTMQPAPDIV